MEPVPATLLNALASGTAGQAGTRAWWQLDVLVRHPLQRVGSTHVAMVSSGEPEFVALARKPDDPHAAQLLSTALVVRAMVDAAFYGDLQRWQQEVRRLNSEPSSVVNTISGSTIHGNAVMGGHISNVTFNSAPQPTPERLAQLENLRRENARDAAYHRFLSRLQLPDLEVAQIIESKERGRSGLIISSYESAEPAYHVNDIHQMVSLIREFISRRGLDELSVYLGSPQLGEVHRITAIDKLYTVASVNRYINTLKLMLNSYFTELSR